MVSLDEIFKLLKSVEYEDVRVEETDALDDRVEETEEKAMELAEKYLLQYIAQHYPDSEIIDDELHEADSWTPSSGIGFSHYCWQICLARRVIKTSDGKFLSVCIEVEGRNGYVYDKAYLEYTNIYLLEQEEEPLF